MEVQTKQSVKTQFAFKLHDPYLSAMEHEDLKTLGWNKTFTQFHSECISMFDLHTKRPKVTASNNYLNTSDASGE